MKKFNSLFIIMLSGVIMSVFILNGCQKETQPDQHFNLDVTLLDAKSFGFIKFTQSPTKIITLDTKVTKLAPNHEYLLQRAVDAINVVDGNCTSTSWLTLGKGLTPQSILTDAYGNGEESFWRDVSTIPSGSKFDIHFQVIDAATKNVVLTSDCYWYQVR